MPNTTDVQRALEEGARRSLAASSVRDGQLPVEREPLTPLVLWHRFKWAIVALGLFLLVELLSMAKLVSVMGTHF